MSGFIYFPIIKTRDSELRCFENIDSDDFDKILPIYELTKSRVTSKAPDGDIYRRMKKIAEIQKERPFILDLCTDNRYINPQIEQLLSHYNGFKEWHYFVFDLHSDLNIIPMIHIYEDDDGKLTDVEEFVRLASRKAKFLAVRLPHDLGSENIDYYLSPIISNMSDGCKLYVVFDAGFIRYSDKSNVIDLFIESYGAAKLYEQKIESIVMLCTSFPSNVAQEGGGDSSGSFMIYEEDVYRGVLQECPIKYGDYASINTEQIEMKGGTFVPRIDVASLDGLSFSYKRYRRNVGGYVNCAKGVISDSINYKPLGVWADKEIELAAADEPSGISPSFWISVRMNYYIKTRILLRAGEEKNNLPF